MIKKTDLAAFSNPRRAGIIAISLDDGDELIAAERTTGGKVLRCRMSGISTMGRATQGVTLMDLAEGEKLVSITRLAERDAGGE